MALLLLGINRTGAVQATAPNEGGAVDMVALLVFDEKTGTCHVLNLNRDMMVNMPMLNEYGREQGTYYGQLAYSHTYGDGLETSSENVRKTVSNLLYGTAIEHYVTLNMDTIGILNDAVGGVTVTVRDDFSAVDPTLKKGRMTLFGQQAVNFVQTRWYVGDELNLSRMERQKEYMTGFVPALRAALEAQPEFIPTVYEQVEELIVTDCSVAVLSRLQADYGDYALGEVLTVAGENVLNGEYYEFYPDEAALDELILRLFYAPKE